jgi:hypothetical protein
MSRLPHRCMSLGPACGPMAQAERPRSLLTHRFVNQQAALAMSKMPARPTNHVRIARGFLCIAALLFAAVFPSQGFAVDTATWNGGNGYWSNQGNWSCVIDGVGRPVCPTAAASTSTCLVEQQLSISAPT